MSNLETHCAEQDAITAAYEAGEGDNRYSGMSSTEAARSIMDETEDGPDDIRRRAARALLCYMPSYEDGPKASLADFLTDLMHLCDLAGWDFDAIERQARRHYLVEIDELGLAKDPAFAAVIEGEE